MLSFIAKPIVWISDFSKNRKVKKHIAKKWSTAVKAGKDKDYKSSSMLWGEIAGETPDDFLVYYNWGLCYSLWAEEDNNSVDDIHQIYSNACDKYEKASALRIKFKTIQGRLYFNWGSALSKWALKTNQDVETKLLKACDQFQRSLSFRPKYFDAHCNYGIANLKLAEMGGSREMEYLQKAEDIFGKAIKLRPYNWDANYNYAFVLACLGRKDQNKTKELLSRAVEYYKKTFFRNPNAFDTFNQLSMVYLDLAKLGGPDMEEYFYESCRNAAEAADRKPEEVNPFYIAGTAMYEWGKASGDDGTDKILGSLKYFVRAEAIKPTYRIYLNWAAALSELGRRVKENKWNFFQDAVSKLKKAEQLQPDDYLIHYNCGTTLSLMARTAGQDAPQYYQSACDSYQKAARLNPDIPAIFYNWGQAFTRWGLFLKNNNDHLFQSACDKYEQAIQLKSDYCNAYVTWGATLLSWGKTGGEEKLNQAEVKLLEAEGIKKGAGAYNLASLFALRGNEEKCKQWLKVGEEAGTLETREVAMKDEDLASVLDKDWFKAIRWKGE